MNGMQPRLTNPALLSVPGLREAPHGLGKVATEAASQSGLPQTTVDLMQLPASQINGSTVWLDLHTRAARKRGETDERLCTLPAWRETPCFTDADQRP